MGGRGGIVTKFYIKQKGAKIASLNPSMDPAFQQGGPCSCEILKIMDFLTDLYMEKNRLR